MVNCPKCKFTQPKDQFCANCGVDMAAFKPPQKPLTSRLFKNWIFQLSIFVFAVVIGVGLIRAKNRAKFSESIASIENATSKQRNYISKKSIDKKFAQTSGVGTTSPQSDVNLISKQAPSASATPETAGAPAQLSANPGAQAANLKSLDGSGDASGLLPSKLKLVFAELHRGTFANILGDSRSIASFGVYFSGLLPDHDDKTKSELTGLNVLDSANDLQIKLNQPIVVFKGSRDPQFQQNIGLTTQITPAFMDEQGAHLQIEVKRTLRSPAGTAAPLLEENFQEQMVLKKGARGYISGLLPHRVLSEEEARSLNANPTILKVLASGDFQNSNSEFVLFIEAK